MISFSGGGFTSTRGTFGNVSKSCDMLCVAFGKAADISFSGGSDGNVFIWKDSKLQKSVKAHEGPLFAIHSLDKVRSYPNIFYSINGFFLNVCLKGLASYV